MAVEDVPLADLRAKYCDSDDEAPRAAAKGASDGDKEQTSNRNEPLLPQNVHQNDEDFWEDHSGEEEDDLEEDDDWEADLAGEKHSKLMS
jgi:hypothetical protein